MKKTFDVIIVGAGLMGCAAAYHLSRAGVSVLLLEQYNFGHHHGSSHGESRIFRYAYPDPLYVDLARYSEAFWGELEADTGRRLLQAMPILCLGTGSAQDQVYSTSAVLRQRGFSPLMHEDRPSLQEAYPQFTMPEDTIGLVSRYAGVLYPESAMKAMLMYLRNHRTCCGLSEAHVTNIDAVGGKVETSKSAFSASRIIIAGGAWTSQLTELVGLRIPLQVTQVQTAYFMPRSEHFSAFQVGTFPIWTAEGEAFVYGFPMLSQHGCKIAFHDKYQLVDMKHRGTDNHPDPHLTRDLEYFVSNHLPGLVPHGSEVATCLYTNTPDKDFVIDCLPGNENIIICSACSGHGAKFSIGIGKILANIAIDGRSDFDISRFSLSRFK